MVIRNPFQRFFRTIWSTSADREARDIGRDAAIARGQTAAQIRLANCRTRLSISTRPQAERALDRMLKYARAKGGNSGQSIMRALPLIAPCRDLAVAMTIKACRADSAFRSIAKRGDVARDRRDWTNAIDNYSAALTLYPLHCGYLVQYGHCLKEAGRLALAEIAYRDAIALGAGGDDVMPHLEFVIRKFTGCMQSYPPHVVEAIAGSPGVPPSGGAFTTSHDVASLCWLFLDEADPSADRVRDLLRQAPLRSTLAARLIADDEFYPANRKFVALHGRRY